MKNILTILNNHFNAHLSGQSRSKIRSYRVNFNVILSFLFKGFSISIYFIMVPITLDYLDANKYGIWLTINSIIAWVGFFDIGIGNGLRNKLSEALANDDLELSKTYISTTYFILFIIITSVSVVFFTVDFFFLIG